MSRTFGVVIALLMAGAPALAAARDIPQLPGPVVDEAGMLAEGDRERVANLCHAAWSLPAEQRVQLQVLLVPSLEGEDLEGFSVRVFDAWKLGDRGKDNGVLVVVARDDRKIRIATGYGTEGALTDAQARRIIDHTLTPAFREGSYGHGLHAAGVQILSTLGALPSEMSGQVSAPARDPMPWWWVMAIIAVFIYGVACWLIRRVRPTASDGARILTPGSIYDQWKDPSFGSWSYRGPASRSRSWSSSSSSSDSSSSGSSSSSSSSWSGGGGETGGGGASGSW
jgi:uncharacterized protein